MVKILGFHCGGPGSIPGWRRSHKPHGITKRKNNKDLLYNRELFSISYDKP